MRENCFTCAHKRNSEACEFCMDWMAGQKMPTSWCPKECMGVRDERECMEANNREEAQDVRLAH